MKKEICGFRGVVRSQRSAVSSQRSAVSNFKEQALDHCHISRRGGTTRASLPANFLLDPNPLVTDR
ncbi:hypothetical protein [Stenomitos frigidus]|uniref:hypothetical protein n=1 Tax=Stenomitos frigidus TaxID=1886765 RepID=UPI0011B1F009|nr:hypothetical protein [Stenomitos frigidus]